MINLETLKINLGSIVAIIGAGITVFSVIWNLADTKRKLENQFQQSQKEIDIAKKDMQISELKLESQVKSYVLELEKTVSDLGSKVDLNTGAIAVFRSLRSNSTVISRKDVPESHVDRQESDQKRD